MKQNNAEGKITTNVERPNPELADKTWDKATVYLECALTAAELKDASKKLADAIRKKEQAEARLEAMRTQMKAEVAELEAIIQKNTSLVSNEKEWRNVDCAVEYDWKTGMKTTCRKDNGEQVRSERISDEERQRHLPLG